MSKERDRIAKFTTDEIDINDTQRPSIEEELLPPIGENIDSLIVPARNIDRRIVELTVEINNVLSGIGSVGIAATNCGCTMVGSGVTVGYQRITIDRQDSESPNHTGVNPFSVGIFGATSNLTSVIGSNTTINTADLGRGIKTNAVVLSGIGNTVHIKSINPAGISICGGQSCASFASSITNMNADLNAKIAERDRLLSIGGNDIKGELKVQYTRRHGLIFCLAETEKRTNSLKKVRSITESPDIQQYFDG